MRHFTFLLAFVFIQSVFAQTHHITKEEYRDKTLAMILGSIGGALTGYEYLNTYNTPDGFHQPGATQKVPKEPLLCLPEDWFILLNGTLGGTTKDEYNYAPWIDGPGRINSDDDQHIDFFNQWLLNKYGLLISYEDIKQEWLSKEVSDFGGGEGAIQVMRDKDLMAPQCGHRDHGNSGHWLPECYIEHEMMGAAFPGMPNKSVAFTDKLSQITGEGEAVQWGYYWAAAHSIAFFETDARTVVEKALGMLPGNSRPKQMYDICVMLHEKYPNDWRPAVRELWTEHWRAPFAVGYDGVMMVSDVNNGTGFLSILYSNNDYMEVLKISSLAGGDGDCTASAVTGLMGIIKGMAGTPQKFKDDIWANGNGVWINDVVHAFSIKKDFQLEWSYDQLVDMFQQNAEMTIRAYGGTVTQDGYTIKGQSGTIPQITSTNWDFEKGTLEGWHVWKAGGPSSVWNERQCNDNTQACFAATGHNKGTILTQSPTSEAKLYQTITGLTPGASYKIEGRINAGGRVARFYAENYGGEYQFASIQNGVSPFPYVYLYVTMGANNTSLDVGLHAPPSSAGSQWCSIDDIIITEIEHPAIPARYEAENAIVNNADVNTGASSSGGQYVGGVLNTDSYIAFQNVMAEYDGEYIVRINYANDGGFAQHEVFVNDRRVGFIEHSDTGPWGVFSANVTDAYVKLKKGANTIRFVKAQNVAEIDFIDVLSPFGNNGLPPMGSQLVDGGIYRIIVRHSGLVLDINGNIENGSTLVQEEYTGGVSQYFQVHKVEGIFYLTPVNSSLSLEILGNGTENGDDIGLWGYWGGENQQWAILETEAGYYKIINDKSGLGMDVGGVSLAPGAPIVQWEYLEGHNQQFRFDFVGMELNNMLASLPGKVEAEDFFTAQGIQTEATTDIDGGQNVAFIENGDWLNYQVDVEKRAQYKLAFRVASAGAGGNVEVYIDGVLEKTIAVSNTGGWQSWQTINDTLLLAGGLHELRLLFTGAGALFNINWWSAQYITDCNGDFSGSAFYDVCGTCAGGTTGIEPITSSDDCVVTSSLKKQAFSNGVYPNPFDKVLYFKEEVVGVIQVYDITGKLLLKQQAKNNELDVSGLSSGVYYVKVSTGDTTEIYTVQKSTNH